MPISPSIESDRPLDLGPDGEAQFERLRAFIEYGQGFELFFCGFENWASLAEVKRRLADMPPPGHVFEALSLEEPGTLLILADRLAAVPPAPSGRRIVFASTSGWVEDLKGEWAKALRRLNERRNITIRECPNAIVLAGPSWLPWLAHDRAPDLWSVRTAVFTFPSPPEAGDGFAFSEHDPWRSGLPRAHELQPPTYYEELAAALEAGRNPGEQTTRGRLLLSAAAAWELKGEYDFALQAANKARKVFADAHDELMVAVAMGRIADIMALSGETDEALRIYSEEWLPILHEIGDVRSRAVTMGKIADILRHKGQTEEALRTYREELLPVFEHLGDVLSRAVTIGRIADIMALRGETEEALRIWTEECLPVAQRIGDLSAIAFIRFACARARLHRGGLDHGEAETILYELTESFALSRKLQHAVGIAAAGRLLGPVLLAGGHVDDALSVLEQSAEAFEKLNRTDEAAKVRELQEQIRARKG